MNTKATVTSENLISSYANHHSRSWKIGLPMYLTTPETRKLYRAFLTQLIVELRQLKFHEAIEIIEDFPAHLDRWWLDEQVLFTQTCGYPYINTLQDQVQLIATPSFQIEGCAGALYHSVYICHQDHAWTSLNEARNSRVVINQADSNSGMNVLRYDILKLLPDQAYAAFFQSVQWSGSHFNSIEFIQNKQADFAAIDCVTWAYLKKYAPKKLEQLHVIGTSPSTNALPYIASKQLSSGLKITVFSALKNVLLHQPALCQALLIEDVVATTAQDYQAILDFKNEADRKRYLELSPQ